MSAAQFAVRFNQKTSDRYHCNKRCAHKDAQQIGFTPPKPTEFLALHALHQPYVYCWVALDKDDLSLDHIRPVSSRHLRYCRQLGRRASSQLRESSRQMG